MRQSNAVISLFSGAMGLDLGLEAAGLKTFVAVEKNKTAVETIRLNRGEDELPVICKKIEDVSGSDVLKAARLQKREAFVVTGGPCCQSFSTAGKRASIGDTNRGLLFRHFKRIVLATEPRFFIMENVRGMLSAAIRHRPLNERGPGFPPLALDEQFGSALRLICSELAELNYYVVYGLLNCADYGVPQKRYRVVFIGSRDGEDIKLPASTHSCGAGDRRWVNLRESIGRLRQRQVEFTPFSNNERRLLRRLQSGENWTNLPKHLQRDALGAAADSWGGRSGFYRRLSWNEPAPTLTTDPNGRATMLCHPTELRPLSVKEYAKLQQFPKTWRFAGSTTQKYIQIGNAVPVGLGSAIGDMLLQTSRKTKRNGLSQIAKPRLGTVTCADADLEKRLQGRAKTKLHPPRLRKNGDPEAARKWLAAAEPCPA